MAHEAAPTSPAVRWLQRSEGVVLVFIAAVLVALSVVLLAASLGELGGAVLRGQITGVEGIEILNSILLVMMIMEIVNTVTVSIRSHAVTAEPFLIIGVIAAIRRMLVITAESTRFEDNPERFRSLLMELGLLAVIVVALTVSVSVLRRSEPTDRGGD